MFTGLRRTIKSGWINFSRNGVVSFSAVLVVTITLFVIATLILVQAILFSSLSQIQDKVDVTVYFNIGTPESKIATLRSAIEEKSEVESVKYVSSEEALADFKSKHENDYVILQALDELPDNPLSAYLNIKARDTSQYEVIVNLLQGDGVLAKDNFSIIEKINYHQNKIIIDRLTAIIDGAQRLGLIVTAFFVLISIIVSFNTIRLTIFFAKEEIGVMKLVGASSRYVRGPFMVEGVIYGFIATLITIVLLFPITLWFGNHMTNFLGINLFSYYLANFLNIFGIIILSGIALGVISSFLAVSKYISK